MLLKSPSDFILSVDDFGKRWAVVVEERVLSGN